MEEELIKQVNEALSKSGERERLKASLRKKLQATGWFDKVQNEIEEELRARSMDSFNPQEIMSIIYPKAIQGISPEARAELQEEIRQFLEAHVKIA